METELLTRREPLILVEDKVPYIGSIAGARVIRLPAADFTRENVREADALIVRTRTRCDATLLDDTNVKVIATATIGTDHIDLNYCATHGIQVFNAPGCNAQAVAQYVMCSIITLMNRPISQHTLAIVGVGHVGTIIERWARALDMKVLRVDPPRQRAEGGDDWTTLDQAMAEADIITFHTPLTREGDDATYHLLDSRRLALARRAPIIINAARGEVVDNTALVMARRQGLVSHLVIDCWENEPDINRDLLSLSDIATPHIAGYSRSGKIRATAAALRALCNSLDLPIAHPVDSNGHRLTPEHHADTVSISTLKDSYNPIEDKASLKMMTTFTPTLFERARNTYDLRPEPRQAIID